MRGPFGIPHVNRAGAALLDVLVSCELRAALSYFETRTRKDFLAENFDAAYGTRVASSRRSTLKLRWRRAAVVQAGSKHTERPLTRRLHFEMSAPVSFSSAQTCRPRRCRCAEDRDESPPRAKSVVFHSPLLVLLQPEKSICILHRGRILHYAGGASLRTLPGMGHYARLGGQSQSCDCTAI